MGQLALATAATAVSLALGEVVVRGVAPQSLRPPWDDEVEGVRAAVPGLRGRHFVPGAFDVTVSVSAQRFRATSEHSLERAPGVTRIAVLGDSLTFGWGAGDEETYPAQLERILGEGSHAKIEVLNAGFPATCLGEKALWFDLGVQRFRPQLVVLTLAGDDVDGDLYWGVFARDEEGRAVPTPARIPRPPRATRRAFKEVPGYAFLAEHSHLFGLFRRAATRLVSHERTTSLGQTPASADDTRRFREEGLPLAVAEIRWLHERVRESGGRLAIVFAPFRESVLPVEGWWAEELRSKSQELSAAVEAVAPAEGIPYLDATPALRARAGHSPRPLFYEGADTHPTPLGYQALAEEVGRWLVDRGLVGAS